MKISSLRHKDAVEGKLDQLADLLRQSDRKCWEIGHALIELLDSHRLSLGYLCRQIGYAKSRLSELHLTARAFPADRRDEGNFYDALLARRVWMRLPRLQMTVFEVRREVSRLRGKRPHQVRSHFVKLLMERDQKGALAEGGRTKQEAPRLIDAAHHADWRSVVPRLPDGSVKLFFCDPPFGGYLWRDDGGYISSRADTSGLRSDADNNSDEAALAVTLPLFEICLPKLKTGGCLLLFQSGGKPDRPELLELAHRNGWACRFSLTWVKNSGGVGEPSCPYAPASERILVFARADERLESHDLKSSRSDVIFIPALTQAATTEMDAGRQPYGSVHMFQKPDRLAEQLIRKHTHPGDLVVEPFGCSGSASIVAARLGRRWCYIESHPDNFAWGSQRIDDESRPSMTA